MAVYLSRIHSRLHFLSKTFELTAFLSSLMLLLLPFLLLLSFLSMLQVLLPSVLNPARESRNHTCTCNTQSFSLPLSHLNRATSLFVKRGASPFSYQVSPSPPPSLLQVRGRFQASGCEGTNRRL